MDPRSIGVRCGSTAILPLVGKAGVQSSAGGISPACPARSLPCAWCMHGRAFRSSLSSPCRSSSVLSVVVLLRGTPRFFGGFRDRGLRASLFIGRLVGISCCWLGCGATGVAVIVAPFIPRPPPDGASLFLGVPCWFLSLFVSLFGVLQYYWSSWA